MKNLLIISLLAATLASCGPTLYVPNTVNAPLLEEKGDFKASIGVNKSAPKNDLNMQGAYAINDKVAVMSNVAHMAGSADKQGNQIKHDLVEAGVGYYTSFWDNKQGLNVGRAEIFGGGGIGWSEDNDHDTNYTNNDDVRHRYTGNYQRLFLQPAVGIKSKIVDVSFATRFSYVYFSDTKHFTNGMLTETGTYNFATMEPVLTTALGYRRGKVFVQVGAILPFGGDNSAYYDVSADANTHFSIGFTFNPWKHK
ncbi:MAG: hypothetical protein IPM82_21620 [Saprospiraceae bacterium]|nr:hypothetical protein [Saprospiraceae bacterium]